MTATDMIPDTDTILAALDLQAGYRNGRRGAVTIVHDVSARLRRGRMVCLLGPNGAGKSTLLRTLVGSQEPLAGTVELTGRPLSRITARERAQRLSVVLTDRIDVGYLTTRELVAIGRTPRVGWFSRLGEGDREIVDRVLSICGADDLADRQIHQLSDGERQRAMIARALAQEPEVLLLDEPTAFLDLTRRVELLALLRHLTDDHGLAVLMSTHELELALRHADEIWLVHPDGRFSAGTPEDLVFAGEIEGAYATKGVVFDDHRGTFIADTGDPGDPRKPIHLDGDDRAVRWLRRGLQRRGWTVVHDPHAPVRIHATDDGTTIGWSLRTADAKPDTATNGVGFATLSDRFTAIFSTDIREPVGPTGPGLDPRTVRPNPKGTRP